MHGVDVNCNANSQRIHGSVANMLKWKCRVIIILRSRSAMFIQLSTVLRAELHWRYRGNSLNPFIFRLYSLPCNEWRENPAKKLYLPSRKNYIFDWIVSSHATFCWTFNFSCRDNIDIHSITGTIHCAFEHGWWANFPLPPAMAATVSNENREEKTTP